MTQGIKSLFLLTVSLYLLSCSPKSSLTEKVKDLKEKGEEQVKVFLADIPIVKRWVKLPNPPQELYRDTEAKISLLKVSKAKDIFAQEYKVVMEDWDKAKKQYERRYYKTSEKLLRKVNHAAEELLRKVEAYEKVVREQALARYKEIESQLLTKMPKNEEERLKIKLYLWKLKNLIDLGKFDEFEREVKGVPIQ